MPKIIFLRHAKADYSLSDKRKHNSVEKNFSPLREESIYIVETISKDYKLKSSDIMISSPYTRALQTAAIINQELKLPLKIEFDLHEWKSDLKDSFISLEEHLKRKEEYLKYNGIYPEGRKQLWETKESLRNRAYSAIKKYFNFKKIIVVSHGMVINSITNIDVDDIPYAGIVEYDITE